MTANGEFDNPPAILLNGSDNITVSFDILGDDLDWLAYRIVYLDHQWRPSTISELEYLRGFNNTRIEDYASSFNTYVPYYHYNFSVPNDEVEMLLPGNYAIEVYRDGDPDDVVATACFSLYEKQVNVNPNLTTNTDVSFNREFQQMHIALDWRKASIVNPAADIFLVVDQNNRRDTERVITTPSRFSAKDRKSVV